MDKKLEINLNMLLGSALSEPLKAEYFKENKNIFSIFDVNQDGKIDKNEVDNIYRELMKYSEKNISDKRENANCIFDENEAKNFIDEYKDKSGKTLNELGATVTEFFGFLNSMLEKTTQEKDTGSSFKKITPEKSADSENTVELTPEQKKISEELSNIPERKDSQFSKNECAKLAQLTADELQKAKELFFVESRENQFSADDIIMLVTECGGKFKVNQENYKRFSEFLLLKDSAGKELSGPDIIQLMTLPSDKIDSAIQLLTLANRANNPLEVNDIVNILECDSDDLIQFVKDNPQITQFEKTRSISVTWLSVQDDKNNITYRYIKGQQYPEEIREEKIDDKTFKRIIVNKNLNIEQTMIFKYKDDKNPLRIETKHLSDNPEKSYTEVMEQSNNPGTPDVYVIDSSGNKTYLQKTIVDEKNGVQTTTKKFSDDKGNVTEFSYSAISENEYSVDYRITDKNGNEILKKQVELKNLGNNKYEYKKDNNSYILETQDNKVTITDKSNNQTYSISYSDYIDSNENPDIFKQNILKIPADILIFISRNPLSLSYGGTKTRDNQGYCRADHKAIDIGTITNTHSDKELNEAFITIIIHELGHYINNPNLSKDNQDILSMSEEFLKVYKEELEEFKQNHSSEEQMIMHQFNGIGFSQKSPETQVKRSSDESFAESNMITNTNSKSWTSARSYYLQRYFPRTVALATKLIQEQIQK